MIEITHKGCLLNSGPAQRPVRSVCLPAVPQSAFVFPQAPDTKDIMFPISLFHQFYQPLLFQRISSNQPPFITGHPRVTRTQVIFRSSRIFFSFCKQFLFCNSRVCARHRFITFTFDVRVVISGAGVFLQAGARNRGWIFYSTGTPGLTFRIRKNMWRDLQRRMV